MPADHNLLTWLTTPIPGMNLRPLDLLRDRHWQALRGATHTRNAPPVTTPPEELIRRRHAQHSWIDTDDYSPST